MKRKSCLRWLQISLVTFAFILLLFLNTYLSSPKISDAAAFNDAVTIQSRLHVLIYASGPGYNMNFCKVMKLALIKNLQISLLGWRKKWTGLISKWETLGSVLDELPPDDVVLFTDAYDVLHTGTAEELLEVYETWDDSKVYFNCEKECWPFATLHNKTYGRHICNELYKEAPKEHDCRYLNTGIWMGKVKVAKKLVSQMHEIIKDDNYEAYLRDRGLKWDISHAKLDDQYLVSVLFGLDRKDYLDVDYRSDLFVTVADGWKVRRDITQLDDGVIVNEKMDTRPKVVHFNSITPKIEFMPRFEDKIVKNLGIEQIPPHTRVLVNGNYSEYQELCYQWPELYDSNHMGKLEKRAKEMNFLIILVLTSEEMHNFWCNQFYTLPKEVQVQVIDIHSSGFSSIDHFESLYKFLASLVDTFVVYIATPVAYLTLDPHRMKMRYLQLSVQYNSTKVWFAGTRICHWEHLWEDVDMRRYCFRKYLDCFSSKCYVRYFNSTAWAGEASVAANVIRRFWLRYQQRDTWYERVKEQHIVPSSILTANKIPIPFFIDLVYRMERHELPIVVDELCHFFNILGEGVSHLKLDDSGIWNQYLGTHPQVFWHSDPARILEENSKHLRDYNYHLEHAIRFRGDEGHTLYNSFCENVKMPS